MSSSIIYVDRNFYMGRAGIKDVLHPEFEFSGPSKFSVAKLHEMPFPKEWPKGGSPPGYKAYEFLKTSGLLERCLNWADITAIQEKGKDFYWRWCSRKSMSAWKSVVVGYDDNLYLPFIHCSFVERSQKFEVLTSFVLLRMPFHEREFCCHLI